jgi:hypothetical protein
MKRLRTGAIVVAIWSAEAVTWALQQLLYHAAAGQQAPVRDIFYTAFKSAGTWCVITLALIGFRVIPRLRERPLPFVLGVHFVFAVFCGGIDVLGDVVLGRITGMLPVTGSIAASYFRQSTFNFFIYALIVAVLHALDASRVSRARAVHAAVLQGQLSEARLEVLKMQLQPHFLFNTLHAMASLVHDDPDAAERMILRLGDLLRAAVDQAGRPVIPVADEIELLQAYLDIQQIRFRDRLVITLDVAPAAERATVPNMILQPLVENAIKHGAAKQLGATTVRIAVQRSGNDLVLEVSNTGGPRSAAAGLVEGVGMTNTKARLAELYPGRHAFTVVLRPEGGARATIRIPFSLEEEDDPPRPSLEERGEPAIAERPSALREVVP